MLDTFYAGLTLVVAVLGDLRKAIGWLFFDINATLSCLGLYKPSLFRFLFILLAVDLRLRSY